MKIVKNVKGAGRIPAEFALMNNFSNSYEPIEEDNMFMIAFLEMYDGHYKDEDCEWIIEEI